MDASALVEYLLRTELGRDIASIIEAPDTDLHTPALCDIEVCTALGRATELGLLSSGRAREALVQHAELPLTRYGHSWLLPRIYDLADRLSPSNATYVALCERLEAALLTGDDELTRSAGRMLTINIIGVGR